MTEDAYKNLLSTNLLAPTTQYFSRVFWRNMTKVPPRLKDDIQSKLSMRNLCLHFLFTTIMYAHTRSIS